MRNSWSKWVNTLFLRKDRDQLSNTVPQRERNYLHLNPCFWRSAKPINGFKLYGRHVAPFNKGRQKCLYHWQLNIGGRHNQQRLLWGQFTRRNQGQEADGKANPSECERNWWVGPSAQSPLAIIHFDPQLGLPCRSIENKSEGVHPGNRTSINKTLRHCFVQAVSQEAPGNSWSIL